MLNKNHLLTLFLLFLITPIKMYTFTYNNSPFQDYTLDESKISETCEEHDIKKFTFSIFDIIEKERDFKEKYIDKENDLMESYIRTNDSSYLTQIKDQASKKIWYHYFFTLITFVFTVMTIFYLINRAIKRGRHKFKKRKMKKAGVTLPSKRRNRNYSNKCLTLVNTKRCRCLTYFCNMLIGFAIAGVSFRWRNFAMETVEGLKKTDCSMSRFFNAVENGFIQEYKSGIHAKYLGVNGFVHFLKKIQAEVKDVKDIGDVYEDYAQRAEELKRWVSTFKGIYSNKAVKSPYGEENKIIPDISKYIKTGIVNHSFFNEANEYAILGSSIRNSETTSSKVLNDETNYSKYIDRMIYEMEEVSEGLKIAKRKTRIFEYSPNGPLFRFYINCITFGFVLCLFLYTIAFTVSYIGKKFLKVTVCCQATFTILMLLATLITLVFGIVSFRNSYLWAKVCAFSHEFKNEKNVSGDYIPAALYKYAETCFFSEGSGAVHDLLSEDYKYKFVEIVNLVKAGSLKVSQYENIEDVDELDLIKDIKNFQLMIEDLKNFQIDDFKELEENDDNKPDNVVSDINEELECTKNEVKLNYKKCVKSPVSSLSDQKNDKKEENYCLVPLYFGHDDINGRYSSTCVGSKSSEIEEKVKNLLEFNKSYQELLSKMEGDLKNVILPKARDAGNELIKGNKAREFPKKILEMMKSSVEFYQKNEYATINNCRNTLLFMDEFIGNVCFSFVYNYKEQAELIIWLSPILFLFSCINFFGVLGSRTKLIEEDLYGLGAVRSSANFGGSSPSKNVDDAPKGWGPSGKGLKQNIKNKSIGGNLNLDKFEFEDDLEDKRDQVRIGESEDFEGKSYEFDDSEKRELGFGERSKKNKVQKRADILKSKLPKRKKNETEEEEVKHKQKKKNFELGKLPKLQV